MMSSCLFANVGSYLCYYHIQILDEDGNLKACKKPVNYGGNLISLIKARNVVPSYFLCCQFEEAIKNSWDAGDSRRHDTLVTSL